MWFLLALAAVALAAVVLVALIARSPRARAPFTSGDEPSQSRSRGKHRGGRK